MVGSLMYLSVTRLDLMFVVSLVSRYMERPTNIYAGYQKNFEVCKGHSGLGNLLQTGSCN